MTPTLSHLRDILTFARLPVFDRARVRLTLWYLLIITIISVFFSICIYQILTREVERFARSRYYQRRVVPMRNPFFQPPFPSDDTIPDAEQPLVQDIKDRISLTLLLVNGVILVIAGGMGYILAGKTLQPIQDMIRQQEQFLSDASHELRTPLTSLKTAFEVHLRAKHQTLAQSRELITESIHEVNKLQRLSESLLQIAKGQELHELHVVSRISSLSLLERAIQDMKPVAQEKHIAITHDLIDAQIMGNEQGLGHLFTILLDNAVKYSLANTHIQVTSKVHQYYLQIRIIDQGIGIASTDKPRIFDRFYRADSARTKSNGASGYGLGLSIARQIVMIHKGKIHVASTEGKGTTFTISLPLAGGSSEVNK